MEKIISQEERIRRAEEIYNRRRYENRKDKYYINSQSINRQSENITLNVKSKLAKKMIIQIIVCIIIYAGIYILQNSNQIFSEYALNKAKEVLTYDINIENLKNDSITYFNNLKNSVNNIFTKNKTNEDNANTENIVSEENNENSENNIIDNEVKEEQGAVGGANEIAQVEEKSQEEQDIEFVKQNINIIWPLKGVITSKFGSRTPTNIVTANHYGIDIAGNTGDSVISAIDGKVTQYSLEGDYGKHLRIENGEVTTLYAHCSSLCVKEGDVVKQGDKIAEVGQTGRATRPTFAFWNKKTK